MDYADKTVRLLALRDIANYMNKEADIIIRDKYLDIWAVTAAQLDTKQNRRLNKELGIKNINYSRNKHKL